MRGNVLAILCLTFLLGFCVSNVQARKWTDESGKYSIDAEFVSVTDGQVAIKRSDGKTIRLAVEESEQSRPGACAAVDILYSQGQDRFSDSSGTSSHEYACCFRET